jgi:hypothetical protein
MTMVNQVQQHPASVDAYIRHGWSLVPIPPGTKGPRTPNWNERQTALKSQSDLPSGWGIGLAHAYSGTMALDIDHWEGATELLRQNDIDLRTLYDAPDAVVIDSGKTGRGKLLYSMPFGLTLPSKKIILDGQTIYELRCATTNGLTVQDVLPPSIHPDTRQPYRWAGNGNWMRAPVLPDAILVLWHSLLEQDKQRNISNDSPVNASWDEVTSALHSISADCSRDEWVTCGMALHYAGTQTNNVEYAFHLWDQWSQASAKYPGDRAMLGQWASFKTEKATSVKLGSLFHLAKQRDWVRPAPDVSTMFGSVGDVKTPIQITMDLRPPAPNLDISLFPEVLQRRAQEISDGVGCDPLVPLFAGLSAVCGAIDARTRLELKPGFLVPPVLWIMTIGDPADKKSPGSRPMFKVLREIEGEDRQRFAKELLTYETLDAQYQSAKKAFIEHAQSADALLNNTIPPNLPPEPQEPIPAKIIVQDITSQKLVRQAAKRPRGLLCYLDEMSSWVDKVCDKRSGDDRSTWTVSYESETYEMDRVGAGVIFCENFALSIFGNIQPQVFHQNVDALSKDGLLQRFIPVPLRHNYTRKGNPKPAFMTSESHYDQMIRSIYALPALNYTLTDPAAQAFDDFQTWYEGAKKNERVVGTGNRFMTAFGKIEGLLGRIVLLWHVMHDSYNTRVSLETMNKAIEFIRTYLIPSLRYTHENDLGGNDSFDMWLADYIVYHSEMPLMTLSDLKHGARKQLKSLNTWQKDQAVIGAMYPLEQGKWVVRMDDGTKEHQHIAQWAINPELRTIFKDHRENVIRAKQALMDEVRAATRSPIPKVKYSEAL